MSHHLDSPLARQDVRLDITDLYVFRGQSGTVLAINLCHSLAAADTPVPGYHPEGMYEFKIDLNRDAIEDITYRFVFGERDRDGIQSVELRELTGSAAADPRAAGVVVAHGSTGQTLNSPDGVRVWTGQAGDPFWIEPDVLHAVGHAFQDGTTIDLTDWTPDQATNLFAGHTVYSIVLEVPDDKLLSTGGDGRIGAWAVSSLQTDAGGWRSINRVGLPMIHPLFTQYNEDLGNRLNAGTPASDFETYGETVIRAVAGVVAAYGTAEDPRAYAERVAHRFLPNVLPYRVGTPAAFGFVEWNGRSLTDNAPDVMFTTAANTPVRLGIGKESITSKPRASFPHVPVAVREHAVA
ncbi:MAG: DUF4331 family protein [Solirubrobacteraceae bacterium]